MKTLNRKRFITLSAIAAGFISLFSFCFGSWTFVQDKDVGFGFQSSEAKPVAYIVGRDEKYTTIEKAVKVANALDPTAKTSYIVSVYVDSNKDVVTISNSFTINSNVTLLIPFVDAVDNKTTPTRSTKTPDKDNEYAQITTLDKATLKKTVVVNSGVTVTNNGTIEIGGELSGGSGGGPYAGQTAGRYSEIIMSPNSKILNNKTIECFGYINDGVYDVSTKTITRKYADVNGGEVVNAGAYFGMPFVLRDYRGGSAMQAIYEKMDELRISAFNQIELMNVNCEITFDSHSQLVAYANLYTGAKSVIPAQMNSTDIRLIGQKNGDLFYLIEPTNDNFLLKAHRNSMTEINDIAIYGGAKTNSMSLKVKVVLFDINVSTEKVFFPLSFRHRINLLAGNNVSNPSFQMDQRFKIMPGSSFSVGKGVTLNVNELAVYKRSDFDDTAAKVGGSKYPTKFPGTSALIGDGRLIVDGTINANSLTGYCEVSKANAIANVKNSTTLTLYEAKANDGTSLSDKYTIPTKFSLEHLDRYHSDTFSRETDLSVGQYTSLERNNNFGFITNSTWYDVKYTHLTASSSFDSSFCDMKNNPVEFNKKTNQVLSLPSYKDDIFVAFGFYYDQAKTQAVTTLNSDAFDHLNSNSDLNLYIDWQEKLCNIKYSYKNGNGYDCTSDALATVNGYKVANPSDLSDYSIIHEKVAKQEYIFNGWKLKSVDGTLSDKTYYNEETIDAETLRNCAADGTVTLEAQYVRKNYVWVEIKQDSFGGFLGIGKTNVISSLKFSDGTSGTNSRYIFSECSIEISVAEAKKNYNPNVTVKFGTASTIVVSAGETKLMVIPSNWSNGENGPITITAAY